jgi:hypothetical protein
MLALTGESDNPVGRLMELNITPTSISYEFDPNDFLKAREFLAKRRDADYKKTQRDDLLSMETGLLNYKGRVHFTAGKCINDELAAMVNLTDKVEIVKKVCAIIDNEIHHGYRIYPINYIAFDRLNHSSRFISEYTDADIAQFDSYLTGQLNKVDLPDITAEERAFMQEKILEMYANPLRNQLIVEGKL